MSTEEKIQALVTLTAGLLASGHYTTPTDPRNTEATPTIKKWDANDGDLNWKEEGLSARYQSHAVADAESLLKEIECATSRS